MVTIPRVESRQFQPFARRKKKTSKEPLTRFFLVVKIVSTILMLENYENHLQMFTSSNKEQMLSFFACFNNYPLHSHVVQLEPSKERPCNCRISQSQITPSKPEQYSILLLSSAGDHIEQDILLRPLPPYLVPRTSFLFLKVTLVSSSYIWRTLWSFTIYI